MSMCLTRGKPKVKHLNKPDAIKHAIKHQRTTNIKVTVYRCKWCKYWHVGRRPVTKKERRWMNSDEKVDEYLVGKLIAALKETLPKRMQ